MLLKTFSNITNFALVLKYVFATPMPYCLLLRLHYTVAADIQIKALNASLSQIKVVSLSPFSLTLQEDRIVEQKQLAVPVL